MAAGEDVRAIQDGERETKTRKNDRRDAQAIVIPLEDLEKCLSDDFSCIKCIRKSVHIFLYPLEIGNELNGVKKYLDAWKNRYKTSLNGILIDYRNITFVKSQGIIISDQPHIHRDIIADFYVLQPSIGAILRGKINRISETHIGCVVHNNINASITLSQPHPKRLSKYAILNGDILFEISRTEIHQRLLRIHGQITKQCFKLMKHERKKRKHQISDSDT